MSGRRTIASPRAILALLTGLNFLNYLDRILVAAVLPKMSAELGLSDFQGGLTATVFLLGYFVTAPVFSALAARYSRRSLIAFGVATWSVATALSGTASNLGMLLAARAIVGIGEASYATLSPTIIDDITPPEKKGKALAIFYLATPLGSALGMVLGGQIAEHWGWRTAFFIGGGPGLLLAITCLWIAEPARRGAVEHTGIVASAKALLRIPQYRRAVAGYIAHTAAVGAFAHWGPTFLVRRFGLKLGAAGTYFGAVTVVAGAIATFVGGRWSDAALARHPGGPAHDDAATRRGTNALLKICALGVLLAAPFTAAAFAAPAAWMFFAMAFVAELGIFLSTSPVNAALLRAVPPELRAASMAFGIFAIHIFGDLGSPPAVGLLLDHLHIVAAMMALPIVIAVAAFLWWPRAREAQD
ncbi:MAG: MFS transporter [Myxococcales bacterium]|nr:MFS transporter [Myxococcales bacterium]